MTARKRAAFLATLAVSLSIAVVTAGSSLATGSKARAPLVLAVEGPQSGAQASNGLDQLRGVQLAVRQLNKYGGLWDGRKVVVYAANDKADAAGAKALARRVVSKGIHFLIGPFNSSVGLVNLPYYRRNHVLPVWMTSLPATAGLGVTLQPMNPQAAPIEARYVGRVHAKHVAMLVDDTVNGAFTKGMARRLRADLVRAGDSVTWTSVKEGRTRAYYAHQVAKALSTKPDLVYVSTYFPEGAQIAKALTAHGSSPRCLMGFANVDNGFLADTTLKQAQRCVFSGVPAAPEMPSASAYVRQYRSMFSKNPGVWGSFTYDSARILFRAINSAQSFNRPAVERHLRQTKGFRGATGPITINSKNGYRKNVPISILRVNNQKRFVILK
ncbi:MAG: branched-chain amino acid ABC transporter substrate-binding protein [Solirubrobacteraceae bacterium]